MRYTKNRIKESKLLFAGLLIGASFGTFGYAVASSPSSTVFYACLNVKAETMNHINTTKAPKCAKGNVNTIWNAVGPKGDTGITGATGQQGPAPDGGFYTVLAPLMSNGDLPYYGTCANGSITHIRANSYGQVYDWANPNSPVRLGAMFYCPF